MAKLCRDHGGSGSQKGRRGATNAPPPGLPPGGLRRPPSLLRKRAVSVRAFFCKNLLPLGEIGLHGRLGRLPQKSQALLGAFPPNPHPALLTSSLFRFKPANSDRRNPAGIKELQNRPVPPALEGGVAPDLAQEVKDLVHGQKSGQGFICLGGRGQTGRILLHHPPALQVLEKSPQGRKFAGHGGLCFFPAGWPP